MKTRITYLTLLVIFTLGLFVIGCDSGNSPPIKRGGKPDNRGNKGQSAQQLALNSDSHFLMGLAAYHLLYSQLDQLNDDSSLPEPDCLIIDEEGENQKELVITRTWSCPYNQEQGWGMEGVETLELDRSENSDSSWEPEKFRAQSDDLFISFQLNNKIYELQLMYRLVGEKKSATEIHWQLDFRPIFEMLNENRTLLFTHQWIFRLNNIWNPINPLPMNEQRVDSTYTYRVRSVSEIKDTQTENMESLWKLTRGPKKSHCGHIEAIVRGNVSSSEIKESPRFKITMEKAEYFNSLSSQTIGLPNCEGATTAQLIQLALSRLRLNRP